MDDDTGKFIESLGDASVAAWREADELYRGDPGTIIAHRVADGLWFEWRGGFVAKVARELWRDSLYGMNDRGELPWLLCVLAIGPGGDYYVIRGDINEWR